MLQYPYPKLEVYIISSIVTDILLHRKSVPLPVFRISDVDEIFVSYSFLPGEPLAFTFDHRLLSLPNH